MDIIEKGQSMPSRSAPKVGAEVIERYLNKEATIELVAGLHFNVLIKDVKFRYGNVDVLITPHSGFGEKWVLSDRVTVIE